MVRVNDYNKKKREEQEEKEEEYSEYKIDIIYQEGMKTFYATIAGLTEEPKWIPKKVISNDFKIKKWYIRALKEGRLEEGRKEKKMEQMKLSYFLC